MKTLYSFILFFTCLNLSAQSDSIPDSIINAPVVNTETYSDSAISSDLNKRNMNYFLELQKENRAKQRKAALVRILIGVGLFAVLVVGIMRRRKSAKKLSGNE